MSLTGRAGKLAYGAQFTASHGPASDGGHREAGAASTWTRALAYQKQLLAMMMTRCDNCSQALLDVARPIQRPQSRAAAAKDDDNAARPTIVGGPTRRHSKWFPLGHAQLAPGFVWQGVRWRHGGVCEQKVAAWLGPTRTNTNDTITSTSERRLE